MTPDPPDTGPLQNHQAWVEGELQRLSDAFAECQRENKILRAEIQMLRDQIRAMSGERED